MQPPAAADQITPHYDFNNNFALDQISAFLGGGIGEHTGELYNSPTRIFPTRRTSTTPICGHTRRHSILAGVSCANVSYWYQNTYGVTLGWQNTWGPANPVLYTTGTDVTNSANGKPNSNAFIIEADWVPFGKEGSWLSPWANLKLGVQYTAYTQFNGGNKNYDGFGRNASDNNTLYVFAWTAF